jgi:hypothetical protein
MQRGKNAQAQERIDWSELDVLKIADDILERGNPEECFNFIQLVCEEATGYLLPYIFLQEVLGTKREAHLRTGRSRMRARLKKKYLHR